MNQNSDNYVDIAYFKGNLFFDDGNLEKAIECYDEALAIDQNFISAIFVKGKAYYELKRYEEAIGCFIKVLDVDMKDADALEYLGKSHSAIAGYDEAMKCFARVLELDPGNYRVYVCIGAIYRAYENYKTAVYYFDKSLEINSENPLAWHNKGLALVEQGKNLANAHKFEEALKCFNRALAIDENYLPSIFEKAGVLAMTGFFELAIFTYLKVIKIEPGNFETIEALARLYKKNEMYENSLAYFRKLLEHRNDKTIQDEINYLTNCINRQRMIK